MPRKPRHLLLAFFPMPFSGELASCALGLHRLPLMLGKGWRASWLQLEPGGTEEGAREAAEAQPAAVLLHIHRGQIADAIAFANALGRLQPGLPVLLCGWPAQPAYIDAVAAATGGIMSPSIALLCGEVEASAPQALERLAGGGGVAGLCGIRGVALRDPRRGVWRGSQEYAVVEDLAALPDAALAHIPQEWQGRRAGWLELSRGCRHRCAFCLLGAFARPRLRCFPGARILAAARAEAARGVEVLGLLAASTSFDFAALAAAAAAVRALRRPGLTVAGTVHARHVDDRMLALLAVLPWEIMTIGFQSFTPAAQRLMRRREDPEVFARTIERIAAFFIPEVEIILGLPGDTPAGFRRTIRCLLDLPVKITVHWLRLDPWSDFFLDRERLGLAADFAQEGKLLHGPGFSADQLEGCREWMVGLSRRPWTHRARALAFSGESQLYPDPCLQED